MTNTICNASLRRSLLMTAAIGCLAFPSAVVAQEATPGEGAQRQLDTITVIARKQEETLQEVPVTVTAIGGETVERYQIDQVADIVSRVPTLNVQVGGSGSGGQLSLRGVGSSNISAAFDSAVAFDFDGVQASSMRLVQPGFFDVEQIDVLKGPQSLFFGKSASAGVLAIRSANPTDIWETSATGSYEFEEQGYKLGGYVSGPLTDTLGIRVAAQYNDISKYVELAPGTPTVNPDRGFEELITRLTLQWDPIPDFRANFKFNYVKNENDGAIQHSDIDCGANGRADEVIVLGIAVPSNVDCNSSDGLYHTPDPAPALVGGFPEGSGADGIYPGRPFGETDLYFSRLTLDYDITDNLLLSSVTGYMDVESVDFDSYSYVGVGPAVTLDGSDLAVAAPTFALTDGVGAPAGMGSSDPVNATEQFSQEFRVTSGFAGPLNFMVGAFYEDRTIDFNTSQQAINISLIAPDPVTGSTFDWLKKQRTETEAISVFGSVTFDVTEQLQLSGGLRYTEEDKTSVIDIPYVHTFLSSGPAFVGSGFNSGPIEFSDDNTSPEVALRYQLNDNINIYGAYKTGFKSGGVDNSALPSFSLLGFGSDDPAVREATAQDLIFASETGEGGEVGVKAELADNTLTLNTSIYRYVFDDLQVQNFDATIIQFQTFNASQLTTQGLDIDFAWAPPVEGLGVSGAFAYTDAEFTAPFITTSGEDLNGRAAARAPEFAGNIAFDYVRPISAGLELGASGNIQYTGEYFTNEDSLNDHVQDSFVSLDGALSLASIGSNWKLSLIGVNLTDEIWVNTSAGRPFLAGPGLGLPVGDDLIFTQNRGRQIFLEAKVRY